MFYSGHSALSARRSVLFVAIAFLFFAGGLWIIAENITILRWRSHRTETEAAAQARLQGNAAWKTSVSRLWGQTLLGLGFSGAGLIVGWNLLQGILIHRKLKAVIAPNRLIICLPRQSVSWIRRPDIRRSLPMKTTEVPWQDISSVGLFERRWGIRIAPGTSQVSVCRVFEVRLSSGSVVFDEAIFEDAQEIAALIAERSATSIVELTTDPIIARHHETKTQRLRETGRQSPLCDRTSPPASALSAQKASSMFLDAPVVRSIAGSIIVAGRPRPFLMHCTDQRLEVGRYIRSPEADDAQQDLTQAEREIWIVRICQAAKEPVEEVRIGEYYCPECRRWIPLLQEPWSEEMCLNCSFERDAERFG
ncbi:MAG: hypothetical protein KDA85_00255 [Planctomycetaceae bacterium]|nr:hypothetical protein [Planctomycetaceae bacterium]